MSDQNVLYNSVRYVIYCAKNNYGFRGQESGGSWGRAYPDTEKKEGLGQLTIYTNHPGGIVEYKHN